MKTKLYALFFVLTVISFSASAQWRHRDRWRHDYGYRSYHHGWRGGNYYGYYHNYWYRPYVPFRIYPRFGFHISILPAGYYRFYWNNTPYYYYDGSYYRPWGSGYETVAPPIGAVVDRLPANAQLRVINGEKFYEANGAFYQEQIGRDGRAAYQVVGTDGVLDTDGPANQPSPEITRRLDTLPEGTQTVVISGEKLYSTPGGGYYKRVDTGSRIYYELVGQ